MSLTSFRIVNFLPKFSAFALLVFLWTGSLYAQPDQSMTGKGLPMSLAQLEQLSQQKESEVDRLVMLYRQGGSDRNALRRQLQTLLDELFELNVKKREAEIKALEREIEEVQRSMEYRKQNKSQIVQKRLKELLGE